MNKFLGTYYNRRLRIVWHILFWICYLVAHTLFYGSPDGTYSEEFFWALQHLPFKMAVTYFTLYVIIPRYLLQKKYLKALLAFFASAMLAVLLQQGINYAIIYPFFHPDWESEYLFYTSKMYTVFLGMYPVVTIASCIKLVKHWYKKEEQAKELRQKKLEAELQFLKAQVHPHFLFNTLNNLYALTLKKSDHTSDVVLKLSKLMNYMLYECSKPKVPLAREVEITETYIALEKIRHNDSLTIEFEVQGSVRAKELPPMLILPFVENSFKHGANKLTESAWIRIGIEISDSSFILKVKNNCIPGKELKNIAGRNNGIGLKNVEQRLKLLYGDDYNLEVKHAKDHFSVKLVLNLDQTIKLQA